jgi:hypothetical protein
MILGKHRGPFCAEGTASWDSGDDHSHPLPENPDAHRRWVAKGLPVLEAVIDRGSIATLLMIAFWLRDREHALAIEAQVAGSTH